MPDKIKVGIIGCGGISTTHIRIYAEHLCEETAVVAVCDIDEAKAQNRAEVVKLTYEGRARALEGAVGNEASAERRAQLERQIAACREAAQEAKVYTDFRQLLHEADVDAVNICVPPFAHAAPTIAAAEAGKHIFCEGPIAGNLRQADEMITVAKRANVQFTVQYGHTRYHRTAMMAKRAIANGDLGELIMGHVDVLWHRGQDYYDSDAWRGTWAGECGGATYHHGRYAIDLYLWLMSMPVAEVYAHMGTYTHQIEVEDAAMALLKFTGGALGQISASTSAHPNPHTPSQRIEIFGSKASVVAIPNFAFGSADKAYVQHLTEKLESEVAALPVEGMPGQFVDFVDAIRGRKSLFIPGASTRAQLEVTKGIYKSVASGAPVSLPIQMYDPYYGI